MRSGCGRPRSGRRPTTRPSYRVPPRDDQEEDSEELTNTTLADASLPSSDDGDDRNPRRRPGHRDGDGGGGGGGGAGGGGDDGGDGEDDEDDDVDDSERGVNCILSFLIDFIQAHSTPPLSRAQLTALTPRQLLASYKAHLTPLLAPSHRAPRPARGGLCPQGRRQGRRRPVRRRQGGRRQEARARRRRPGGARRLRKAKAQSAKDKKERKRREKRDTTLNLTQHSLSYIRPSTSLNHSLSFNDTSYDPTLSLTTEMLEPRTVTFTLSTHDLPSPAPSSSSSSPSSSHVLLALFSSSLSQHSLYSYIGQTERRPSSAHIAFERPLTMRDVRTWHAKDTLRVSAYDVTGKGGEEEKDQMGQVHCDTYALFTAFTTERVTWELLKAQEAVDAVLGYSERRLECAMQGGGRVGIHAIITPALTVDAYPPSPGGVKRSAMGGLDVDTSLSMSALEESAAHLSSSLAAISFQDPVSPIYPLKDGRPSGKDGRRHSEGPARTKAHAMATQSDPVQADSQATQTDRTVVLQRVMADATTMTDAPAATIIRLIRANTAHLGASLVSTTAIEPSLRIDTAAAIEAAQPTDATASNPSSPHPSVSSPTAGSMPGVQTTLAALSSALAVPFPNPHLRLSAASQQSLQRIVALLRRQLSASLQWFLDTSSAGAGKGVSAPRKPIWNPSINPASAMQVKFSTIRMHSHWQPDHATTTCGVCVSPFGLLKRKHHCRLCGMAACDECTRKTVELAEVGLAGQQRVCDFCEQVWSVGKGLKTVGEKKEDARAQPQEKEPQVQVQAQAVVPAAPVKAAGKKAEKAEEDSVISSAPVLSGPTASPAPSRTVRKTVPASLKKKAADKEEPHAHAKDVPTPAATKRVVTRSLAAKENVHVNVPPTPLAAKRTRAVTTPATKAAKA